MKKSRLRLLKRKRSKREILRDKAWNTFSRWIRARDKRCVTCGGRDNLQAGHFYHGVLDFDEININTQDTRCNKWLHGNLARYANYLLNKYGIEEFQKLEARHYIALKGEYRTEQDYKDLISKYSLVN